jgi:hypothetical protein
VAVQSFKPTTPTMSLAWDILQSYQIDKARTAKPNCMCCGNRMPSSHVMK